MILVAGTVSAGLIGCVSGLFLMIAVSESAWWLHTHSYHAANRIMPTPRERLR